VEVSTEEASSRAMDQVAEDAYRTPAAMRTEHPCRGARRPKIDFERAPSKDSRYVALPEIRRRTRRIGWQANSRGRHIPIRRRERVPPESRTTELLAGIAATGEPRRKQTFICRR